VKQTEGGHGTTSKIGSTSEGTPEIQTGLTSTGRRMVEGSQAIPSEETNTNEDEAMIPAFWGWKAE